MLIAAATRIKVAVCVKCGRGFVGKSADVTRDELPIWFTRSTMNAVICNGAVWRVDRMQQIEKVYADTIVDPGEETIV